MCCTLIYGAFAYLKSYLLTFKPYFETAFTLLFSVALGRAGTFEKQANSRSGSRSNSVGFILWFVGFPKNLLVGGIMGGG